VAAQARLLPGGVETAQYVADRTALARCWTGRCGIACGSVLRQFPALVRSTRRRLGPRFGRIRVPRHEQTALAFYRWYLLRAPCTRQGSHDRGFAAAACAGIVFVRRMQAGLPDAA